MKKIITSILIIAILCMFANIIPVSAASLDTISITTNKQIVNPEEEVELKIEFGKPLGAYTFDIAYDSNLLEYISSEGGTANDTGDKVRVYFFDSTGGTSPREYMKIIFKAKSGIQTSNPTNFSVTAEGLANADASVSYDDIGTPIIKNITVEPKYEDYQINLTYSGTVYAEQEIPMQITTSSNMGRYYAHARLIAEATSTSGGTVTLKGTDNNQVEHEIIQSGWGDASGYEIGGKVEQILNVQGLFTRAGDYNITLKLIDRDNSDTEIAKKTINIKVEEKQTQPDNGTTDEIPPEEQPDDEILPETQPEDEITDESQIEQNKTEETSPETLPNKLPKTGKQIYIPIILLTLGIITVLITVNRKKSKH